MFNEIVSSFTFQSSEMFATKITFGGNYNSNINKRTMTQITERYEDEIVSSFTFLSIPALP